MKVLYAIQGTGNGHISRAREIIPHLTSNCELDLLISGTQSDVHLPQLVKFKRRGISFSFGKNGGIDRIDTILRFRPYEFYRDIYQFPVEQYDLIINDFEPITAWACKIKHKKCFGLSHQAAFLSPKTPRIEKQDKFSNWILKNYAPVTDKIGFHFQAYDNFIQTPVIRSQIRKQGISNRGHITVYLPAYSDEKIIAFLSEIKNMEWHVFSKHSRHGYYRGNISVQPIHNNAFVESLCSSDGLICNAGFEGPAEAMYLHKKLLVVPMKNQYEQLCNAKALKLMGVQVLNNIGTEMHKQLEAWLNYACPVKVNYYDQAAEIVNRVLSSAKA
ncbi:glycosyltransferase family protein [Bacteroidota bacterium]